jgi:peptidoglycan DL-endopeptidase CwlO
MFRFSRAITRWVIFPLAISLLAPLTLANGATTSKKPIPTLAQISAAKAAENAKAKEAAQAAAKLNVAKATLFVLTAKANAAKAKYQSALTSLAIANQKLNQANRKLAAAKLNVSAATSNIGRLAQNAYEMGGGSLTTLSTVLNSNGPQDLMDQLSTVKNIGNSDRDILNKFQAAQKIAASAQLIADKAKQVQIGITLQVAKTKAAAARAQNAQQQEVNRLTAIQQQIINELAKDRNYRLTLEQQRAALLLEEQNSNVAPTIPNQAKVWPVKPFMAVGRSTPRSNPTIVANALAYAKAQVLARKPYVWGGAGPNNFDCSGLVYASYHAAGLGYPSWSRLTAALYYGYTTRVPLSALQPGDVLFYSFDGSISSIHHITIYAGNNMMWEANSTRTGLLYSNIFSVPGLMPYGGRI